MKKLAHFVWLLCRFASVSCKLGITIAQALPCYLIFQIRVADARRRRLLNPKGDLTRN